MFVRLSLGFGALLLAGGAPAVAAVSFGGGLEGGLVAARSEEPTELDKNGPFGGAHLGLSFRPLSSLHLALALGLQSAALTGESQLRTQELQVHTVFGGLEARYGFGAFEAGFSARMARGKAASTRAADRDTSVTVASVGPELAYRFSGKSSDLVLYIAALVELNVPAQRSTAPLVGLQLWLKPSVAAAAATPPSPSRDAKSAPPPASAGDHGLAASPAATTSSESNSPPSASPELSIFSDPAPTEALPLRIRPEVLSFDHNSSILTAAEIENVKSIGAILSVHADLWAEVEIAGHSDGRSRNPRRNLELSEQRAVAVAGLVALSGVPAARIVIAGYGGERPIPATPPQAKENRRIVLRLEGVRDAAKLLAALEAYVVLDTSAANP